MLKKITTSLSIIILLTSCTPDKWETLNDKGLNYVGRDNYIEGTKVLREAVISNPDYLDGVVNYRNTYPIGVSRSEEKIKELSSSGETLKLTDSYEDYLELKNGLYTLPESVKKKLALSLDLPSIDEIKEIKMDTGVANYNSGELFLGKDTRYDDQQRYYYYNRTKELYPTYKDITEKQRKAYEDAKIIIGVNTGMDYSNYIKSEGIIEDQLSEKLLSIDGSKGRREKTLSELISLSSNPSKVNTAISISVEDLSYNPPITRRQVRERYWDEVYYVKDSKGNRRRRTKRRRYIEYTFIKTSSVSITATYEMRDKKRDEIIGKRVITKIAKDQNVWSEVSGRAPSGSRGQGYERPLKSKDELVRVGSTLLADDIFNEVLSNL